MLRLAIGVWLCAAVLFGQFKQTPVEALHAAARAGDTAEVIRLLATGVDVDARDSLGGTPLLDAVWEGREDAVRVLVAHGADVNAKHLEAGVTALQYAVLTGRAAITRELLQAGAHTDVRDRSGEAVLHVAAARGNLPVVDLLLEAHADVGALDQDGYTALESAIFHNQLNLLPILLAHGASATRVRAADGRQPIHLACVRGFAAAIPPLISAGASPVAKDRFGQTPLDLALAYKNAGAVAELLKFGLSIRESQSAADSAMETATMRGHTEIVRLLLDGGYDVNRTTPSGSTFLNDAALKGQKKVAQLLMDHGANVNAPDSSGTLPLHNAAIGGDAEMAELLLDHGARIDARERESKATALMLAASLSRTSVVGLLLKRGADLNLKDKSGHSALDRARETDSTETIELLQRH